MNIGSHEAITPFEHAHRYDADWRFTIAMGSVACPEEAPRDIRADKYLREQVKFLRQDEAPITTAPQRRLLFTKVTPTSTPSRTLRKAIEVANDIHSMRDGVVLKDKLDALLLCEDLDYNEISMYTNLDREAIEAYENIFFNVRNDEGKLILGMWLREHFALGESASEYADPADAPLYWRTLAMTAGSKVLLAKWGWLPPDQLPEAEVNLVVFRNLLLNLDHRIRYGKIDAKSSMDMLGRMKELVDDMRARGVISSNDSNSEVSMIFKLLQETAPVPPVPTDKQLENKVDDVQGKLNAIAAKFQQVQAKKSLAGLNKTTSTS